MDFVKIVFDDGDVVIIAESKLCNKCFRLIREKKDLVYPEENENNWNSVIKTFNEASKRGFKREV